MKKLYIVGIGPGHKDFMTNEAFSAIEESDLIAGFKTYVDLVKPYFPSKQIYSTGMTFEKERCIEALKRAQKGETVALVCSGDSGVYGMASLVLELIKDYRDVEIKVIAGVSAALSGGAVLGSPLSHDFAVISLSNLLTPQHLIEKRLICAAQGDFCIALYNPRSHKRTECLRDACNILLKYISKDTVCGWVRNIGRAGEEYHICTLDELKDAELDMFCTAFIGNSTTVITKNTMRSFIVTPRGYNNI